MKKSLFVIISTSLVFIFASCSSAPKRAMEVSLIYNSASSILETANAQILSGNYDNAALLLKAAYKQAMSIDNYDLLTSISLAYANLELSYNPPHIEKATDYTKLAEEYAEFSSNTAKLSALVELNKVRLSIANKDEVKTAQDYKLLHSKLDSKMPEVKNDIYSQAQFVSVKGDLYMQEKNYSAAQAQYTQAAKIYTDNRYLSEIGITWYKLAQARSLSGNKESALEAMEQAIYYDRCAENSLGLATDYKAVGTILLKGNPTQKEKEKAEYAFMHSLEILESLK